LLLDLLSGIYGLDSYRDLLNRLPKKILVLEQLPTIASSLSWYALQGPDPIERMLAALVIFQQKLEERSTFETPGDLLRMLEKHLPQKTRTASERVAYALEAIEIVRARNQRENPDAPIRVHFEHVMTVLERQLQRNMESGFLSPLGLPPNGNIVAAMIDSKEDAEQLGGAYNCGLELIHWLRVRQELLYRNTISNKPKCNSILGYLAQLRASNTASEPDCSAADRE
jgi:hypothetical protein